jgi:hypothetical protein
VPDKARRTAVAGGGGRAVVPEEPGHRGARQREHEQLRRGGRQCEHEQLCRGTGERMRAAHPPDLIQIDDAGDQGDLFKRVARDLPWVTARGVSARWLRHTALAWAERGLQPWRRPRRRRPRPIARRHRHYRPLRQSAPTSGRHAAGQADRRAASIGPRPGDSGVEVRRQPGGDRDPILTAVPPESV